MRYTQSKQISIMMMLTVHAYVQAIPTRLEGTMEAKCSNESRNSILKEEPSVNAAHLHKKPGDEKSGVHMLHLSPSEIAPILTLF